MKILEVINVTKKFGGLTALDRVNIKLDRGELRGIIGPNGSGKTTLINVISGYLTPTEGKIIFKGEDITALPPHVIARKGIGRAFQLTNIFKSLTVYENIWTACQIKFKYANPFADIKKMKEVEQRVEEILKFIGLSREADRITSECTFGEQRLIEFGIVLGMDPEMLLLDEPTTGLSPQERQPVINLIKNLIGVKTIIIVEHSMDVLAQLGAYVTVLHRGQILAEGPFSDVVKDEKVQRIYLGGG